MKYRKKPIVIEAVKWNGANYGLTNGGIPLETEKLEYPDWLPPVTECKTYGHPKVGEVWRHEDNLFIGTLEGTMQVSSGDWIIKGAKGELYPCKPDIFEATYEAVE